MKNNFLFLFVLLLFFQSITAQEEVEKTITGQIFSETSPLEGVTITNTKSKQSTISDQNGDFSIAAKEGDILKFSTAEYETLVKQIKPEDLKTSFFTLHMTAAGIELKEVIINEYADITAEKLGIVRPGQVKFTPAERKLYSGSGGVVGFINLLTGELKSLKANVEVEKKEILLRKLEYMFEDKYYMENLKIPGELIKGFKYYCVEDVEFGKAVNSKNKTMCMFLIIELASSYNKKRISTEITE
ncbi:hypothetical protein J2Y38_002160 [Flavobacterium sp. 2755]|uniref:carboxypeptidase-like regulatory domain-containing protein n=1 Tax=Flavobacterium sp. 2755 TaxID=2817765 RepID=UPI00285EACA8|nr:carboxypeptidase-like regulatory domain-containing protein [Flavobacterium sp. 2755]MDR6761949.1 hypothetical protein [Flavobacterium sp. 2755]